MSNEEFIKEIKKAVIGEKNNKKVVHKLIALGFEEVRGGKKGVSHLTHERLGGNKVTLGNLASDIRGVMNFLTQIRHAMWKAAA